MVEIRRGNVLEAETEALVNTVNCVGFMGKGIALQFKKAYPENFKAYQRAVRTKQVRPGRMFVFETNSMFKPRYIINFPTKTHWRGKSRIEDITSGSKALVEEVKGRNISSIAIPPLGCGLGGLDWQVVRPIIEEAFNEVPDVQVLLYEPVGAPTAISMPIRTRKPRMTAARALFIMLMKQYSELAYRLTLLEIQKLGYFLQEAGEQLRLRFQEGHYGPYADNLNKVVELLEGHYTSGYGDTQKPDVEIELMPGASDKAADFLADKSDSTERLARVRRLIEGFETPYGMELLSSVHWVAHHRSSPARDADDAVHQIHAWSNRKRRMFRADHILIAWNRLEEKEWLPRTKTD